MSCNYCLRMTWCTVERGVCVCVCISCSGVALAANTWAQLPLSKEKKSNKIAQDVWRKRCVMHDGYCWLTDRQTGTLHLKNGTSHLLHSQPRRPDSASIVVVIDVPGVISQKEPLVCLLLVRIWSLFHTLTSFIPSSSPRLHLSLRYNLSQQFRT